MTVKIVRRVHCPEEAAAIACDSEETILIYIDHAKTMLSLAVASTRADPEGISATFEYINRWQVIEGRRIDVFELEDYHYLGCFAGRVWKGRNIDPVSTDSLPN